MARLGSVENAIVIGIFAVIVSILGIAVWGGGSGDMFESGASGGGAPGLNTNLEEPLSGGDSPVVIIPEVMQKKLAKTLAEREEGVASQKSGVEKLVGISGAIKDGGVPPVEIPVADVDVAESKNLEGELVAGEVSGTGTDFLEDRPETNPADVGSELVEYLVQDGDNIWSIARQQYGDGDVQGMIDDIIQHNPAIDPDLIYPGMRLRLPRNLPEQAIALRADAQYPSAHPPDDTTIAEYTRYEVQEGDTLQGIARDQLGDLSRWMEIYDLNRAYGLEDPDQIVAGITLLLPKSP